MAADQYRLGIQLDFRTNGDQDIHSVASCSGLEKGGKERKDEKEWRMRRVEKRRRVEKTEGGGIRVKRRGGGEERNYGRDMKQMNQKFFTGNTI